MTAKLKHFFVQQNRHQTTQLKINAPLSFLCTLAELKIHFPDKNLGARLVLIRRLHDDDAVTQLRGPNEYSLMLLIYNKLSFREGTQKSDPRAATIKRVQNAIANKPAVPVCQWPLKVINTLLPSLNIWRSASTRRLIKQFMLSPNINNLVFSACTFFVTLTALFNSTANFQQPLQVSSFVWLLDLV